MKTEYWEAVAKKRFLSLFDPDPDYPVTLPW